MSIGSRQKNVLAEIVGEGYWHNACGWKFAYYTERVLESLVKRGLATVQREEMPIGSGRVYRVYRPTPEGERVNATHGGPTTHGSAS